MGRVCFDQVQIDAVTMDEAVARITDMMSTPRTSANHVVTVNAQFVQLARSQPRFADLIRRAELSVADGVPLVWASRFLGHPLPERVNGTDLMVRLCEAASERNNNVYFLGGRAGSAERAAKMLQQRSPGLRIAGIDCPGYGFEENPERDEEVCERIRHARPDLIFVALGSPKAEYWIRRHLNLPAKVMVGVGGSFELVSGMTKRAPRIFQQSGCEWLWRFFMEPRRLWRRYFMGNTLFVYLFVRQWLRRLIPDPIA